MTLDEAIKHCEEVAEEEEKQAIWLRSREGNLNYKNCVKRAEEYRQLSEWLKELKALREVCVSEAFDMAIKALEQEPKTGHWIVNKKVDTAYDISGYKSWAISYACEHCGFIHQAIENHGVYSYCPNCGVKMAERSGEDADRN